MKQITGADWMRKRGVRRGDLSKAAVRSTSDMSAYFPHLVSFIASAVSLVTRSSCLRPAHSSSWLPMSMCKQETLCEGLPPTERQEVERGLE